MKVCYIEIISPDALYLNTITCWNKWSGFAKLSSNCLLPGQKTFWYNTISHSIWKGHTAVFCRHISQQLLINAIKFNQPQAFSVQNNCDRFMCANLRDCPWCKSQSCCHRYTSPFQMVFITIFNHNMQFYYLLWRVILLLIGPYDH